MVTVGTGNSPIDIMDAINEGVGPTVFAQVDYFCRAYVEGG